ncbi:MAG: vanadium-dependent haloperoxidase [Flavisolibacter sp.]
MKSVIKCLLFFCLLFISCKKSSDEDEIKGQTKNYSSEVAQKWHDLQLQFLRLPPGPNPYGMHGNRYFAYSGIALYESVVAGMPGYQSLQGQLTNMPAMPPTESGKSYHWPTSANAALAFLTRYFYPTIANMKSIDSLENDLNIKYKREVSIEIFQRSVNYGTKVAEIIFEWSKTDNSLNTYPAFVPAIGPGIWSPTAPNPTAVSAPYWGNNRLFVQGSLNNTSSAPPPPYSTDPNSAYYKMVKEVYDISKELTPAQIATAIYFRDNPGFQSGTHYQSIFSQVMHQENPGLDFYAIAMAKTGIALAESQIGCWKMKYDLLVERPIRYIRNVLGYTNWNPVLTTPPHPDFPSGHSQTGGALATILTSLFGDNYGITLHTYDNLGMEPRTYKSFNEMVDDIGKSRVYAGIHYSYSCTEGAKQGGKIAENILKSLKFKK